MASSKSSKRSSSLPFELVEEILYRIPIEYLVGFKSTCKQWYALINDKRFIYKLLGLSQKRFIQVDHLNKSIDLFNLETQALSSLQFPTEIHTVIHCDGLLLCLCGVARCFSYKHETLAVWNPFLSRVEWIEPSNSYKKDDGYGFGYDNVSRDNYKILRFNDKSSYIEIYDFKSKLWSSVDAALDSCVELWHLKFQALSMNGNMYWIAHRKKKKKKGNSDDQTEIFIQSFDFSTETFKDIGCSVSVETDCFCLRDGSTLVMSGFGGDRLSLLQQHKHVEIEVWVTNKVTYDGVVSWSKFFHVTHPDLPDLHGFGFPTFFIDHKTNNNIMVCCSRFEFDVTKNYADVNVYELMGDGDIIKQVMGGNRREWVYAFRNCCFVYVPSLVPIPE